MLLGSTSCAVTVCRPVVTVDDVQSYEPAYGPGLATLPPPVMPVIKGKSIVVMLEELEAVAVTVKLPLLPGA